MKNTNIQTLLNQRFAAKKFDPTKKVAEDDIQYILECARLSCSSFNIQSWQISVITNPDIRAKLREAAFGQEQVTDASHLFVISSVKDEAGRAHAVADMIRAAGGAEAADAFTQMVLGAAAMKSPEQRVAWLQKQTYLALQVMILAAAERGLDSSPMEGFDPAKFAEILGETETIPTTILAVGYAAAPGRPKMRLPLEQIVKRVD